MTEIQEKPNKYRNSTNSRYLNALFFEMVTDKTNVLYTLKDEDHLGYPSLYRLYMELDDLTEYEFATTYFDGWEHWTMLCSCEWFKPYVERWRHELELKTKAAALRAIKHEAAKGGKNAYSANKVLLEGKWTGQDQGAKRGRPSNNEINKAAKELAERKSRLKEDSKRLGIV